MHPYEWGILGVKAIALGWLSDERFPRACSTSAGCFACKQDSGRAKALGIRRRCRTAPTGLRRARQRSFVTQAVVYTNRLAPGFLSDWQEHSSILVQTAPSNFLAKASRVSVSATRSYQQFLSQSCKNPKLVKSAQIRLLYVYLTWLAMRLAH